MIVLYNTVDGLSLIKYKKKITLFFYKVIYVNAFFLTSMLVGYNNYYPS